MRPLQFEYVRSEMHTQFANVATPNEIVIVTQFSIEFGSTGGTLHICMPYSMIEPIRDMLSSPIQGEALEVDRRWVRVLSQQVQAAEVELTVDLAQMPVDVRADPEHAQAAMCCRSTCPSTSRRKSMACR